MSITNPLTYVNTIKRRILMLDVKSEEVKSVIHLFKIPVHVGIKSQLFLAKKWVDGYIGPLTYLINYSISDGIFPSEVNLVRCVPIFKSEDPSLITNLSIFFPERFLKK